MGDLFYTNMYSVMYQWSDFRVSKHLYKAYFNAQNTDKTSSSSDDPNEKRVDTSKLYNYTNDQLGSLTSGVTSAYSTLKTSLTGNGKDDWEFDYDAAYNAASSFVGKYNEMVAGIGKSGNATVVGKANYIDAMANSYKSELASVGITIDKGQMKLDEAAFRAASQDQLKAVFTDKGSFGAFINSTASSLHQFSTSSEYTSPEKSSLANSSSTTYNASGAVSNVKDTSTSSILDCLV